MSCEERVTYKVLVASYFLNENCELEMGKILVAFKLLVTTDANIKLEVAFAKIDEKMRPLFHTVKPVFH